MTGSGSLASLDDWLAWLPSLSASEIDLGLERVAEVCGRMSLPRPNRVLTVAGTNGKGSSVMMLEAVMLKSGVPVGAYISPHIVRYEERIRVNGSPAAEDQIVAAFRAVEDARSGVPLTYFEFGTLAALSVFATSGLDTVVLEVGLGGRLDAVNVVDHDGCIITNVSMDHADWLGDSIGAIAREKAGVMRQGRPAIFGASPAPPEIRQVAEAIGAQLRVSGEDFSWAPDGEGGWSWQGRGCRLERLAAPALPGRHQIDNASAVLALLECMERRDLLEVEFINSAWSTLDFPGRQQRLTSRKRDWLLDGAHNAAGAESLAATLPSHASGRRTVLVLGILDDKDSESIIGSLAAAVDCIVTLTAESARAIPADKLADIARRVSDVPVTAMPSPPAAFETAVERSDDGDLIVVAGSFYTLGPALRWLGQISE